MLAGVLFLCVATSCLAAAPGIVRPCHCQNTQCLRDNLAANSKCNPAVKGYIEASYSLPEFKFETPYFNASYVDTNLIIKNHDKCFVSEFFFNVEADRALLAIDCYGLSFASARTLIQHNPLVEDTEYNYNFNGTYPHIRLTTTLKNADTLDLCSSYTFAYVSVLPTFHIDPRDNSTANFLSTDLTFLNIFERETFFYRAPELARYFINSLICNFGCNQ